MKVVISGPTGVIGHAIIEECLAARDEVLAICRTGSKRNAALPKGREGFRIIECDLKDYGELAEEIAGREKTVIDERYDVFYHLAWNGTVGADRMDTTMQEANVRHALDAVRLAHTLGCNTFIGAGSQAEYGRVEGILTPDTPTHPENEYGRCKRRAGIETRKMCQGLGLRHIWARVLSVYGPFDGENSMVTSSLRKMIAGEDVSFTAGEQMWDYLYASDAGRAFRLMGEKGIDGKTYVLGSGECRRLKDYIRIMTEEVKYAGRPGIGDLPYAERQVMYLQADITDLRKDTGFAPEKDFREGIQNTIEYLKENSEQADRAKETGDKKRRRDRNEES